MSSPWHSVIPIDRKIVHCENCGKVIYHKNWLLGSGECKLCSMQLCIDCAKWNRVGECQECQKEKKYK